jgi:hypothetical protein
MSTARFEDNLDAINKSIKALEIDKATLEGKASQRAVMVAYGFSALAILLSIAGLVMAIVMHG